MARIMAAALLFLLVAGALPAYATDHIVGDSSGWRLGVKYDNWASGKTFVVGDTLPSQHDVVEVRRSNYSACTTSNSIKTYTDGNTSITLTETGSRFFICSFAGHCAGGMKLAVTVSAGTPTTPSSPSPPSPPSGSTSPPPPSSANGPSSPPPPLNNNGACRTGFNFYSMKNTLLMGALLMVIAR